MTSWEPQMRQAMDLATQASLAGDVPVGALVLDASGKTIGTGFNQREADCDPTAHAELLALRQAAQTLGAWRLTECTLVVTLEPCTMCAGALVLARIKRVVFGAWDPKAGAGGSVRDVLRDPRLNHIPEVVGAVLEAECAEQLHTFFTLQR